MNERSPREDMPLREGISRRTFDLWIVGQGRDTEELLAMYLESQGHRAYLVDDVESAVMRPERLESLDGVVINLTGENERCERAVRLLHEARADLGIAVLVGAGSVGFQQRLYASGASQVIQKPCAPKLLVSKIERTAARTAGNLFPESRDDRPVDRTPGFEGSIDVLGVPELLLVLSQNMNSGWLTIRSGDDRYRLAVDEGNVLGASGPGDIMGRKAAFRAIRQTTGTFWYAERESVDVSEDLKDDFERMDNLVLLAVQEADELPRAFESLPDPGRSLFAERLTAKSLAEELGDRAARALEPLTGHRRSRSVAEVIEGSPLPDIEVAKALIEAIEHNLVEVADDPDFETPLEENTSPSEETADTPSGL